MDNDRGPPPGLQQALKLVESIAANLQLLRETHGDVATLTAQLEEILKEIRGTMNCGDDQA